jgi:hypothetical protein
MHVGFWWGKPEGKRPLENIDEGGWIIFKWIWADWVKDTDR